MTEQTKTGKWKWPNIIRNSKGELAKVVYGIWRKSKPTKSFSDFWHGLENK